MHIEWDASLETGVETVDQQHRELFRRVNVLLTAMWSAEAEAEVSRMFDYLANYAEEHFACEEDTMTEVGYPDRALHAEQHDQFRQELGQLHKEYLANGLSNPLTVRLNRFVCVWLKEHISRSDRALGEFIRTGYRSLIA